MNIMIDTVFMIINFLARVGLVIYIVKRYVIQWVMHSMINEREKIVTIDVQYRSLQQDCDQLADTMDQQRQHQDQLQIKFDQWKKAVAIDQQYFQQFCIQQQLQINKHHEIKIHSLQQRNLIQQECIPLLEQISKELKEDFAVHTAQYQQYQKHIFESLSK